MADNFNPKKWCRFPQAYQHLNGAVPEKTIRQWASDHKIASSPTKAAMTAGAA